MYHSLECQWKQIIIYGEEQSVLGIHRNQLVEALVDKEQLLQQSAQFWESVLMLEEVSEFQQNIVVFLV